MKRAPAANGLSEFKQVLSDFRQMSSLAVKGVVAAPLADVWLRYGPPPAAGIAVLTSVMEFAAIVWVFQAWHTAKEQVLLLRMRWALGCFCICLAASLVLLSNFSVSPGPGRERVIEGATIRPEVAALLGSTYSAEDALRESEYDAAKVWTNASVTAMRTLVTALWVATFVSLAIYLMVFISLQRRRSLAADQCRRSLAVLSGFSSPACPPGSSRRAADILTPAPAEHRISRSKTLLVRSGGYPKPRFDSPCIRDSHVRQTSRLPLNERLVHDASSKRSDQ